VPSCKISSKSAKRFLRYRDFSIFKIAAVRHAGFDFEIFQFLVFRQFGRSKIHYHIPFLIKIGRMAAEISHLMRFSKLRPSATLDFCKIDFLNIS